MLLCNDGHVMHIGACAFGMIMNGRDGSMGMRLGDCAKRRRRCSGGPIDRRSNNAANNRKWFSPRSRAGGGCSFVAVTISFSNAVMRRHCPRVKRRVPFTATALGVLVGRHRQLVL